MQSAEFAPLQKRIDQLEEELKDIKYKKDLMKKWALRFHCAFTGCTKEQAATKYQGKPFSRLISDVLGEVNKYADHLVGDEVDLSLLRILHTLLIRPSSQPSRASRSSTKR